MRACVQSMSQRNARLQLQLGDAERLQAQAELHSMLLYRTLMEGMLLVSGHAPPQAKEARHMHMHMQGAVHHRGIT